MNTEKSGSDGEQLQAFHGPLQRLILGVLVESNEPIPAKAVKERLEEAGTERAQSTISTELARLSEKDIIERSKDEYPGGFRYLYKPGSEFEDQYIADHLAAIQEVLGEESLLTLCEMVQLRASDAEEDLDSLLNCG